MIKSTMNVKENIDISKYKKLIGFLKRSNDTYTPVKSKVFTMANVEQFVRQASDADYLLMKVILLFGINGACRRSELCDLLQTDVTDTGSIAVVTLRNTKTKKNRTFTVTSGCNGYNLYKKYVSLRPKIVKHNRFFISYNKGVCTKTPIGVQTIAKIPQNIAKFRNLPNFEQYTGHCFRRSSATFLADSGVDIQVLKRHGG